jgi:hypothetical protein
MKPPNAQRILRGWIVAHAMAAVNAQMTFTIQGSTRIELGFSRPKAGSVTAVTQARRAGD